MNPEEKSVIDAALAWEVADGSSVDSFEMGILATKLVAAVRGYRKSLESAPRYTISDDCEVWERGHIGYWRVCRASDRIYAERIARLLNEKVKSAS